jgi:hypothetical protein
MGYAAGDPVGYIIGGYRYGEATIDGGKFILTLRRAPRGEWKIAADLDEAIEGRNRSADVDYHQGVLTLVGPGKETDHD